MINEFLKLVSSKWRPTAVSVVDPLPVAPMLTSGGNGTAQTSATGANWVTLTAQVCKQVTFVNNTGTAIEVRQGGAGTAIPVVDQSVFTFYGITNASDLSIRRVDTSNTQVTIAYRWEA